MTPIILFLSGSVLIWIGMSDSLNEALGVANEPKAIGYPNLPFLPYAIAAMVVTAPLAIIPNNKEWAWKYVTLILLAAIVTNYEGINKFYIDLRELYNRIGGS